MVFGRRSAVHAIEYIKSVDDHSASEEELASEQVRLQALLDRPKGERVATLRNDMARGMTRGIGVFRDQSSMEGALENLENVKSRMSGFSIENKGKIFNTDLMFGLELEFMVDCAEAVVAGALTRKESRGAHFRTDITERDDDNWLKHTLVYKDETQEPVSYTHLTLPTICSL